tara:strand:- start:25696 stop:26736 length:1041 start_codon:yes stop_codon:yes gene_type:complete
VNIQQVTAQLVDNLNLRREEMAIAMRQIMTGQCTDAQIGAFLIALKIKGESIEEILGAAQVMRDLATPVSVDVNPLIDIAGTGGDGANLFNVSSAATFVAAAAGAYVAKHGNRAVSSSSGSADLLETAGIKLTLDPYQVARCIEQVGVGFMYAPAHHSAMKNVIIPRRELGLRTIFNLLGPITNPAGVKRQVIGVYAKSLCRPVAEVLKQLGSIHALVVHSDDGLDEFSLACGTHVAELKGGNVNEYDVAPEQLGIRQQSIEGLDVSGPDDSLALIKAAFNCNRDPKTLKATDMIALNAGAAIYVAGLADSIEEGVSQARMRITDGSAAAKLQSLAEFSQKFAGRT